MRNPRAFDGERAVAVFIDFENIGLSLPSRGRFDIDRVLDRILEKGKVVVKKAYADWGRFPQYTGPLHEAAIELIEIPKRGHTGKNSADIRMCVDALDMAYSRDHIGVFVIVSGDSDFLAARLEVEGTRPPRHRPRPRRFDLGAFTRQLRRVHLLRRPREAEAGVAELCRSRCRTANRKSSPCSWSRSRPSAAREQRDSLVVDGQGHDEAKKALV